MKYYDFLDKAPAIPPMVIIEGTERQFSDLAIAKIEERLKQEDPNISVERHRAPQMDSFRPIAEGLVALGFFSSRKLLIIRDIHELRAAPRRTLWDVAQTVTEPSVLVLEELVSPTKKSKPEPLSAIAPRGALKIDTTASAQVRARYIEDTAKAAGVKIEAAALRVLTDGGADLGAIKNDIERLALEGAPIRTEMLARESVGVEDPKAYKYAGAIVAGNDAEAFRIAADLFADDPRGAAIPLLSALATEYGLLWELARGNGELPSKYRWRERTLKPLAQKIGARAARRGFERAVKGFEAIVTGRADDPRLLVEAISAECAYERAAVTRRR